ncbi:MAG: Gfo/Idh/MocA family oxidoreductase [Saprospiraceae bacterium]|nr:MAG: oxidoreductase domain-containing protein [Candidatus Parvibacillus calidus]MCC7148393.1 Gfo/Idh/MocA family oxidoreductase [Saprospiraceae bacterium]WKZ63270.1 MAG: Gfo/Idh/MocA family oxidoreductase [Saprospiraceae bacterium]
MEINFGIIGLGHIGMRHLDSIEAQPDANVIGICDPHLNQTQVAGIPVYTDITQLLAKHPDLDVVNICTPNGLHAPHAIQCIEAGKHVVIEKPMSLTKKDAEKVIFHALNRHVKVFCVMQNRYTANARYLKHLVTNNALGRINEIDINLFWNRDKRYYISENGKQHGWRGSAAMDGGPLFTQFSHFVDLIYWLFGDIEVISADMSNRVHEYIPEIEDNGVFMFRTSAGARGMLRYSINAPFRNIGSSVQIIGDQGAVKVSGQYLEEIEYCDCAFPGEPSFPILDNYETHRLVIRNVIDSLSGGNAIDTNAVEGMKVVEIIESVYGLGRI